MNELGNLIRQAREEKQWSQRQLAYLSRVSNTEIKRIEDGERRRPSPEILERLAKALGLAPQELFAAAGYPLPGLSDREQVESARLYARLSRLTPEGREKVLKELEWIEQLERKQLERNGK